MYNFSRFFEYKAVSVVVEEAVVGHAGEASVATGEAGGEAGGGLDNGTVMVRHVKQFPEEERKGKN